MPTFSSMRAFDDDQRGWSAETALEVWDDCESSDDGDEEYRAGYDGNQSIDMKPTLADLEEEHRPQPSKFNKDPYRHGYAYHQPAWTIIPDVEKNASWSKASNTLKVQLETPGRIGPRTASDATRVLSRLSEPNAVWGLIEELVQGKRGGCGPCVSRGVDCVVKLECPPGLPYSEGLLRVIGRCVSCAVFKCIGGCDIVVKNSKKERTEQGATTQNTATSSAGRPTKNPRAVRTTTRSLPKSTTACNPVVGVRGGPLAPEAPRGPSVGSSLRLATGQGRRKRKASPEAQPLEGRHPATRKATRSVSGAISSPSSSTASTQQSLVLPTADIIRSDPEEPGSSAIHADQPKVDGGLVVMALQNLRENTGDLKAALEEKISALTGRTKALFTMMDRRLATLDRIMSSTVVRSELDRTEAIDAVTYMTDFLTTTRGILAENAEGPICFLVRTMLDVMEDDIKTLKKAAEAL